MSTYRSYQDHILDQFVQIALKTDKPGLIQVTEIANRDGYTGKGRLVFTSGLNTIAELHYDFGEDQHKLAINGKPGHTLSDRAVLWAPLSSRPLGLFFKRWALHFASAVQELDTARRSV